MFWVVRKTRRILLLVKKESREMNNISAMVDNLHKDSSPVDNIPLLNTEVQKNCRVGTPYPCFNDSKYRGFQHASYGHQNKEEANKWRYH